LLNLSRKTKNQLTTIKRNDIIMLVDKRVDNVCITCV